MLPGFVILTPPSHGGCDRREHTKVSDTILDAVESPTGYQPNS